MQNRDGAGGNDNEGAPKTGRGRFFVPHRGGTRVEVGEPIHVGGERPWLCAAKLVSLNGVETAPQAYEPTHTLLVRTGRGHSPDEAQRAAIEQLTLIYGSPAGPPPAPIIIRKVSDNPPPVPEPKTRSWLARLFGFSK